MAALVTGSFVVAAVGAFYTLRRLHPVQSYLYLRGGTFLALIASALVAFPSGDQHAKAVVRYQPVTLAAMECKFVGGPTAGVAVIGQQNAEGRLSSSLRHFRHWAESVVAGSPSYRGSSGYRKVRLGTSIAFPPLCGLSARF